MLRQVPSRQWVLRLKKRRCLLLLPLMVIVKIPVLTGLSCGWRLQNSVGGSAASFGGQAARVTFFNSDANVSATHRQAIPVRNSLPAAMLAKCEMADHGIHHNDGSL